ncbi:hypothetical protein DL546_008965 [Coniochaeta pulveracea]|uniref:Uncharacterized protein n=1 Tax=Coniochaeta pulveracea TaxID=177199 RepID=A0A420YK12_9PEZI|nr:hypothetical protein DL546_008965 [Coniochaeta pulveracea]
MLVLRRPAPPSGQFYSSGPLSRHYRLFPPAPRYAAAFYYHRVWRNQPSNASSFGSLFFTSGERNDNRLFACLPCHVCGGLVPQGQTQSFFALLGVCCVAGRLDIARFWPLSVSGSFQLGVLEAIFLSGQF